jgi:hypothetical protein
MATGTVIKIKYSGTNGAPTALATGELAYSFLGGDLSNGGDRLFIGTGTETNGEAANIEVIGGKYFTQMLDHTNGVLTANSALIVDANKKIDDFLVDNLHLDGNTISIDQNSDANGDLYITPGGNGVVNVGTTLNVTGNLNQIGDQQITGNLLITGSGKGNLEVDGEARLASAIVEDLTATRVTFAGTGGALVDDAGFTYTGTGAGGTVTVAGTIDVNTEALLATAKVEDLTNNRIVISGVGGELEDDANFTFDGTSFKVGTDTVDKFVVTVATGNTAIAGDLSVGGAVSFTKTTGTALDVDGQATLASLNVEDLTATRVVFAGSSGELVDSNNFKFDSTNNTLTVNGDAQIDNINIDGNVISATNTNGSITITPNGLGVVHANTNTALRIPVGTSGQRNAYSAATGDLRYNTDLSSFEGFDGTNWSGLGGVIDNDRNTYIVTADNMGGLSVPASPVDDTLYFVTGGNLEATMDTPNGFTYNNVNINGNTVSTTSGNLFLDPGQTGASSPTGDVVVYGNLQVMGTTTQVNSTTVTVDDPIFTLGGDTAPTSDDNKDRGIEYRWHDGTTDKVGFFGYDDSAERFTFIADATNVSEVFAGAASDVAFGNALVDSVTFSATNFTANSVPWVDTNGDVGFLEETASPYGTDGQVLQMDTNGVPFFGHIDCGTY